jgi:aminopeptidase-like protein
MYSWTSDLFPICRSLTGRGLRQTLAYLQGLVPELQIYEVPTGYKAFDWTVPDEWEINNAFIANEAGERIIDFQVNNLHLMSYSEPIDAIMSFAELDEHLYSLPSQADAIPYVTSYYKRRWGFCLTERQRAALRQRPEALYHVKIESRLFAGSLSYGEYVIKGESKQEVLLSTYICHPSMANNELSGPVVAAALVQYIKATPRRYTYRIIFIPETLGSIVYLSKNLEHLQKHVIAGFVLTCLGDNRAYSYLASRYGNTYADKVAKHVLHDIAPDYKAYSFLQRGSDERQFCAPGVDLPVCSIMRSKYGEYPEYHTSLDDMQLISPEGLAGGYNALKQCIDIIENNHIYKAALLCEPQMGARGLYSTISHKGSTDGMHNMMNVLAYADGKNDLLDIADICNIPLVELLQIINILVENSLIFKQETN